MLTFHPFRNTDPPVIAALWRSRAGQPGLLPTVSLDLFEQLVFAKLYFDYDGLIIARDDGRPVGFAHAGFGPNAAHNGISTATGVICMVLVRPDCAETEVAAGLLERCAQYLRDRGAKVLLGGGLRPLNPFYVGLYGGSELPGVLETDTVARQAFAADGYTEGERTLIMHCNLDRFEATVDRRQMEIRRRMIVEVSVDPPSRTWWDACTLGEFDMTRFALMPRGASSPAAYAVFRNMEPTGSTGFARAEGLMELHVDEAFRRRGLAVFLLTEAFRQFIRDGIAVVETQALEQDAAAVGLFKKLGLTQVGQGSVWRKQVG
jgi:ribosomal protein S18 acetylase RimI-like enzyme